MGSSAISLGSSAISFSVQELGKLLSDEAGLLYGLGDEIRSMQRELTRMQCLLRDLEMKQGLDARVTNWVREIREITYKVEDVVDTFKLHYTGGWDAAGFVTSVKKHLASVLMFTRRHTLAARIRDVRKDLNEIMRSKGAYDITAAGFGGYLDGDRGGGGGAPSSSGRRLGKREKMSQCRKSEKVVDFKKKKLDKLEEQLYSDTELRQKVVSIVGMGGSGKTTLARLMFCEASQGNNNGKDSSHFNFTAWVNISREFRPEDTLKQLAEKMGLGELTNGGGGCLCEKIEERLYKHRYLIVLDDVWRVDVWDYLRDFFPDNNNRSRVLLTTRDENVARSAIPCFDPIKLERFNKDQSLQLITERVLKMDLNSINTEELKSQLETHLGEKTLRSCGGLPLALGVVGDLLAGREKKELAWKTALMGIKWHQTEAGRQCMNILALSYVDLPDELKSCFRYLCLFPKDREIGMRRLILMWIAEGFVVEQRGESVEETAIRYLDELIEKNLIQIHERGFVGNVKTCRVHTLLHDLAKMEAEELDLTGVCEDINNFSIPRNARRLAIHSDAGIGVYMKQWRIIKKLRTIVLGGFNKENRDLIAEQKVDEQNINRSFPSHLKKLTLLKVLDLQDAPIKSLPGEIWKMAYLRYLGLRNSKVTELPKYRRYKQMLQTLDVRKTEITVLPKGVWRIKTLRNIYGSNLTEENIGTRAKNLIHLQSLRGVPVGGWIEKSGLAKLDSLQNLKLCGSLQDYHTLRSLPPKITIMSLSETKVGKGFWKLLEKMECLRILILDENAYAGRKLICHEGCFPRLQVLRLARLEMLEQWEFEEAKEGQTGRPEVMPHLAYLTLERCQNLNALPINELLSISTLLKIELKSVPQVRKEDVQDKFQNVSNLAPQKNVLSVLYDGEPIQKDMPEEIGFSLNVFQTPGNWPNLLKY